MASATLRPLSQCRDCGADASGLQGLRFMFVRDDGGYLLCRSCYGQYLGRRAARATICTATVPPAE